MFLLDKQAGGRLLGVIPKHSRVAKALDQSVCAEGCESHFQWLY